MSSAHTVTEQPLLLDPSQVVACGRTRFTFQFESTSEPLAERAVTRPGGGCLSIPQLIRHHPVEGQRAVYRGDVLTHHSADTDHRTGNVRSYHFRYSCTCYVTSTNTTLQIRMSRAMSNHHTPMINVQDAAPPKMLPNGNAPNLMQEYCHAPVQCP